MQPRQKGPRALKLLTRLPDDAHAFPEGRLAALRRDVERLTIQQPNLVVPEDVGSLGRGDPAEEDAFYLVSELVDGPDLYKFTARASWTTILEVVVSILRGLEALHARGALHGHLCAENVLVSGQGPRKSAKVAILGSSTSKASWLIVGRVSVGSCQIVVLPSLIS